MTRPSQLCPPPKLRHCFAIWLALVSPLTLLGCVVAGPASHAYSATDIARPQAGKGVVFGKRCEGSAFSVENLQTKEKILYHGSYPRKVSVFALMLPAGTYSLQSISAGGDAPSVVSRDPFRFMVKDGQVAYIGTVIKSWSIYNRVPREYDCQADAKHIVARKLYHSPPSSFWMGLNEDSEPDTRPLYAADYLDGVLPEMKREFPSLDLSGFDVQLMR